MAGPYGAAVPVGYVVDKRTVGHRGAAALDEETGSLCTGVVVANHTVFDHRGQAVVVDRSVVCSPVVADDAVANGRAAGNAFDRSHPECGCPDPGS